MIKYKANIEITGGSEEISEFIQLLAKIQMLGEAGANRTIPVAVDGDGSGQLSFMVKDIKPEPIKELIKRSRSGKLLNMDSKSFEEQMDDEMSTHYIGE